MILDTDTNRAYVEISPGTFITSRGTFVDWDGLIAEIQADRAALAESKTRSRNVLEPFPNRSGDEPRR